MARAMQQLETALDTGLQTDVETSIRPTASNAQVGGTVMARHALQQLGLYEESPSARAPLARPTPRESASPRLCAGCRAKEARYGFRPDGVDDPTLDRPRTLCFECFRVELSRRQEIRERMARGWNARQVGLPLEDTLRSLDKRRRRAQIAARHALGA